MLLRPLVSSLLLRHHSQSQSLAPLLRRSMSGGGRDAGGGKARGSGSGSGSAGGGREGAELIGGFPPLSDDAAEPGGRRGAPIGPRHRGRLASRTARPCGVQPGRSRGRLPGMSMTQPYCNRESTLLSILKPNINTLQYVALVKIS